MEFNGTEVDGIPWMTEFDGIQFRQGSLKDPKGRRWKNRGKIKSMTEKRNQRKLLWFQTGGALNFITAAPHCGIWPNQTSGFITKVFNSLLRHRVQIKKINLGICIAPTQSFRAALERR
jgi:hypothetical protein